MRSHFCELFDRNNKKELSIDKQLKLVCEQCPDLWEIIARNSCPRHINLPELNCICHGVCDTSMCEDCWKYALKEIGIVKDGEK